MCCETAGEQVSTEIFDRNLYRWIGLNLDEEKKRDEVE